MKCVEKVKENNVSCPCKECRYWMNYEIDYNCSMIAIEKNKAGMTLEDIAKRMKLTPAGVKYIQDRAQKKLLETKFCPTIYQ